MYLEGRGVRLDYTKALNWTLKAAEQGSAVAKNYLGIIYADGLGVSQDYAEAARLP